MVVDMCGNYSYRNVNVFCHVQLQMKTKIYQSRGNANINTCAKQTIYASQSSPPKVFPTIKGCVIS